MIRLSSLAVPPYGAAAAFPNHRPSDRVATVFAEALPVGMQGDSLPGLVFINDGLIGNAVEESWFRCTSRACDLVDPIRQRSKVHIRRVTDLVR